VRISEHFRTEEFRCRDGSPVPLRSYAPLRLLCRHYLEPLRGEFGPVSVMSGHRTASYNRDVGGAARSQHVYGAWGWGVAADVRCASGSPADWHAFLDRLDPGGLGAYSTWVHVDNRRGRARW
jgi:uncharacterized protein YcbK (DUF882 family)